LVIAGFDTTKVGNPLVPSTAVEAIEAGPDHDGTPMVSTPIDIRHPSPKLVSNETGIRCQVRPT
jgi:hypothetical protein